MEEEPDPTSELIEHEEVKSENGEGEKRGSEEQSEGAEEEEQLEEQEEHEEEEEEEVEEEEIIEYPHYNTADFISEPHLSQNCTLPNNIIEFDYSYGYDCRRYFNLSVIDQEILIFASGNLIHFLNARTGKKWYRRCFSGEGIGHITTNPVLPHVAVGERGEYPHIIIYEWPSFEIVTVLERGTKREYSHLNYNPDGELLCSQGGYPDYTLTIWNWRKHRIMLRAKAYGERVFNAKFSLYVPGHLTTSGISHIKFWKINKTFTGLKLQGELGRFGKTEICNVIGFLALPDEQVVSGCEWGNMLIWEGGLIRVEVCRRGKNFCHEAPITQFIYNNGELTTVAMDGTIKIWYYETIEFADPPEEERFIEVEPIFEFEIGDYYHKAELMAIVKSDPNPQDTIWFGQDGNGGIWKLDLSVAVNAAPPQQIYYCHAGHVIAIQASPISSQFATLGRDGRLLVYDYKLRQLLFKKEFLSGGTCLLWLPLSVSQVVEDSGTILIGGFEDGCIRVMCISASEYLKKLSSPTEEYVNLVQVVKPHSKDITIVAVNVQGHILVTGSKDWTIFVFQIRHGNQFVELVPIGFIPVNGPVSCYSWKPKTSDTILIGCGNGAFMEIELPLESETEDPPTYLIENANILESQFLSVKSEIRRNQRIEEILAERRMMAALRKAEQEAENAETGRKSAEFEEEEEEEEIDESELPEIHIPPVPNPVLLALYNPNRTIWLSMGGYDSGYMYEYNFTDTAPLTSTMIDDADDIEISSCHFYHNEQYLIFGMQDGKVRVTRVNHEDINDFSDYWSYPMHDNKNGIIYQICFNQSYKYMFTCGSDGNVFVYRFYPEDNNYKTSYMDAFSAKGFPITVASDIDDPNTMSLEQMKTKIGNELQLKNANARKRDIIDLLKTLEKKYESLMKRNSKLPKSQQLTRDELVLDARIVEDLEMSLSEEMDLVKRKLIWNLEKSRIQYDKLMEYYIIPMENIASRVYGIENTDKFVETFRLRGLGSEFAKYKELVAVKLEEQELKGRAHARLFSEEEIIEVVTRRPNPAEALLKQIMGLCGDYKRNIKLRRLLRKYRERKDRLETRRIEWHEIMRKKPNPNKPDPEDVEAIKVAKDYIGDYKLKTASDYKVPPSMKLTTVTMYDKLLKTREKIYELKKEYNNKVFAMRQRKIDMIERHTHLRQSLLEIAKEIPKDRIRDPPELPTYDENEEFPERKLFYTESDVFDELPRRHRNLYRMATVKKKEIKSLDKEYEMLIQEKKNQKYGTVDSKLHLMKFGEIIGSKAIGDLEMVGKDDHVNTPWEKEFRKLRVMKRLYEQDCIIEEMENNIKSFDEDIYALKEAKYNVEVDAKFLEIYLLTVHQQVLILKKFEAAEEEKENKLFEKMMEKHDVQKKMNEINAKIEGRNREIRRCEELIKNLVTSYHAAITDNKFYDFLRRIFKKKYRPPKVKTDDSDSDSESESSSSSEEEDAKSLDSKDIGPIRLDENVCPPGCDPTLYEWTFKQRSTRHTLELMIVDEKKMIESHRKEYEMLLKKMKAAEDQLVMCQKDLEEYMREKQRNLNEVETVVVLHMHQIQNLKSEAEMERLSESVVFSSSQLSNLYKRVGELEKETEIEKQKHAKNCQHLTRMKIDINHMRDVIEKLKKEIDETMLKKFGTKVDIDDIEESLIKRLVADMHSIVLELERRFDVQLRPLREKLSEREETFAMKLQENTERHNLLTVLEEEKLSLRKMKERQKKIICTEHGDASEKEFTDKLEKVVEQQERQLCELKTQIRILKMKVKPMPPIVGMYSSEVSEVVQRLMVRTFEDECAEITMEIRNELKDIYDEAQEIAHDLRGGLADKSDIKRMRQLTEEFIEKLPETVQTSVIKKLSEKNILKQEPPKKCLDRSMYLRELVRAIPAEFFLEIMDMVTEILDTISTTIEVGQAKLPEESH